MTADRIAGGAPLRVAFLSHARRLYGASRSLLDLIDGLAEADFPWAPHVVCQVGDTLLGPLAARGVPTVQIPLQRWMARHEPGWQARLVGRHLLNLLTLPVLLRQLRAWRIDLVYTNGSVLPSGAVAARLLGLPHVWHIREFGEGDYRMICDFGRATVRRWLRRSPRVVAVSEAVRRAVIGEPDHPGARVVYNGVAGRARLAALDAADRPARSPDRFTFVLVGLFMPGKRQEDAIRAFSLLHERFPAARLELVGDAEGIFFARCRALAGELGLGDRVTFRGFQADPWPAYLAADAALMCSEAEAFGRVTAEAMIAGLPVVGRASGGTPELIEHERTGLLYHGGPAALAAEMARLLEAPKWAAELGARAAAVGRARFTNARYADEIAEVMLEAAGQR